MSATTNPEWPNSSGSSPTRAASRATPPRNPRLHQRGGELGYSLAHAYGSVFDNPDLITAVVIGATAGFQ